MSPTESELEAGLRRALNIKARELIYLRRTADNLATDLQSLSTQHMFPVMGDFRAAGAIKCMGEKDKEVIDGFRAWLKEKIAEIAAEVAVAEEAATAAGYYWGRNHADNAFKDLRNACPGEDCSREDLLRHVLLLSEALRRAEHANDREIARRIRWELPVGASGSELREGPDGPRGRRTLKGKGVHCGAPLKLLTKNGWVSGRFESVRGIPRFHFSPVPGSEMEVILEIDGDMEFAWPEDLCATE